MGETTTEGDEGLRAPGRATTAPTLGRSTAQWWSGGADPTRPATTVPSSPVAAAPSPQDLRAGAQIVGLERRRHRTNKVWWSGALFGLAGIVVALLGLVVFVIDALRGDVSSASALSASVGVMGFMLALNRYIDDDAGAECTPAELGDLVGYVAGQENGEWAMTPRGEAAKAAYLALDPEDLR